MNHLVPRYEFDSGLPGQHLLVLGGIHGNEPCGPRALGKIIDALNSGSLKLTRGRCTLVPICNPRAFASDVRSLEENLNRIFTPCASPESYEAELARDLCPLVEACDTMLDLHSMQSRGVPFVFLNQFSPSIQSFCEALGPRYILRGWADCFASHPSLVAKCTQSYADLHGKPNALIECGHHSDPAAALVAEEATLRAMAYCDLINPAVAPDLSNAPVQHIHMHTIHLRTHESDRLSKEWKNFEPFSKGELLGTRADGSEVRAIRDGLMILPSPVSAVGTEWFFVGELASGDQA